jgi:hypothetical protein
MSSKTALRALVVAGALLVGMGASPAFATGATGGPAVTVRPRFQLTRLETVMVRANSFPANTSVAIVQCNNKVGTDGSAACAIGRAVITTTTKDGRVKATPFKVHTGKIGDGTCNHKDYCFIVVSTLDQSTFAAIDIHFSD